MPTELADGLWRWTARHPEWHPGEFGREVAAFALRTDDGLVLVDPLLPDEPGTVVEALDALVGDRVAILITIPYHVRSAEPLWRRFRDRAEVTIWGHRAAAKRLDDARAFRTIVPGAPLPGGARAYAIGRPRRFEMPLHLPSHRALAFGDAVVETGGELRVWAQGRLDERRYRYYRERFNPTLEPLVELDVERVLVTHGAPVLSGRAAELARALEREPWILRG
jgi:glyoxylase-like metal-dependent hydrolase (beta-lactamase superfamily II)